MSELNIAILTGLLASLSMKTEANIIIKKFKQKALKFLLKALKYYQLAKHEGVIH